MITETIKSLLFQLGFNLQRITPPDRIAELIARLAPVMVDKPLIRLGESGDGGYLVPDDLDGVDACFSPGVYEVATFEQELAERGIVCYLADNSVEKPPVENRWIHFEKKHLGVECDDKFMTLDSWVVRNIGRDNCGDLMLQMDIERAEYSVLLDTPIELLEKFRIIVIEFHDMHKLFDRTVFGIYESVFKKLCSRFHVVHIHPNNWSPVVKKSGIEIPPLLEFTFYRKDRGKVEGFASQFPHELDSPNVPGRPELALPSCWQRQS